MNAGADTCVSHLLYRVCEHLLFVYRLYKKRFCDASDRSEPGAVIIQSTGREAGALRQLRPERQFRDHFAGGCRHGIGNGGSDRRCAGFAYPGGMFR